MNKRSEQKAKTRAYIIEVALSIFAKQGILQTKTSDIATEAGISHGSIFSHFATREILIEAVIDEFGNQMSKSLHELVRSECNMRSLLEGHLKGIARYEDFYKRLITESTILPDNARITLIGIQSAVSLHLSQVAKREMANSEIINMPVHLLFNTWNGLISYYLMNGDLFAPGESVVSRYGEELINHYLRLISLKGGE